MDAKDELVEYCELVSREGDHKNVLLKDGVTTILGRGDCTGIKDTCCSRKQVEVFLNLSDKSLVVKSTGSKPCIAGGTTLSKGEQTVIGPGASLQLLSGQYKYSVFFGKCLPSSSSECEMATKRQLENGKDSAGEAQQTKRFRVQATLKKFFSSSSNPSAIVHTCKWMTINPSLLKMTYGNHTPSSLVASFDLDGTLISTKSGLLPFRTGPEDWKFWDPCVPKKLYAIHSAGYRIVIFTNQGGMNYGNPPRDEFELKLQAVMESVGDLPVTLFAAIGEDDFRKPRTGMWDHFVREENKGMVVDMSQSYYIGDAAGRASNWKKGCKKDFSCSDRKFAANAGLPFHTPEEFFMGEPPCPKFSWDGFNPFSLDYDLDTPTLDPPSSVILSPSREVVVFVGCPASGKTTFFKTHMADRYLHINRDTLGTWQKCVSETEKALSQGRSVVIDNTNPDPESRGRYIQVARKVCGDDFKVRCFLFTTSLEHAIHNNHFRERVTKDPAYKKVGWSAFSHYRSYYCEPKIEEGFSEIVKVTISMKFSTSSLEKIYKRFYE